MNCAPLPYPCCNVGIAQDRSARCVGRNLLEYLQPFRADAVVKQDKTCGVAAGPGPLMTQSGHCPGIYCSYAKASSFLI